MKQQKWYQKAKPQEAAPALNPNNCYFSWTMSFVWNQLKLSIYYFY